MKIMAFGKDMAGNPLFQSTTEDVFAASLTGALKDNASELSNLARTSLEATTFRGEIRRRVIDAGDPRQAGWTFLVALKDPQREEIVAALRPLAEFRGMEDPGSPLTLDSESEEGWGDWLQDNYYGLELTGQKTPQYVLIVGSPRSVPLKFQATLDCVANVGRLDFDTIDELKRYVEKILRLETASAPVASREVVFFGTDGGVTDPTYFSREYMVQPLAEHVGYGLGFRTSGLTGFDATKRKLLEALRDANPALIYTASHGLGLTDQPLDQQKRFNGAICCQARGALTRDDLFCADDVPLGEPFLEGAVFFQFACFGYGTPVQSDYSHWLSGIPQQYASEDFVAALPKRLLAHPRGPIAYVGHLDTAFLHGFTDQNEPRIADRWHARIEPFVHAVESLLRVQPCGLAMDDMNKRFAVCNALLTGTYDRQTRGSLVWTSQSSARFVDSWIIRSDAQNYMVFGDPAARLRIPEA